MFPFLLFHAVFALHSLSDSGSTCGSMKKEAKACAEEFQGLQLERCRVCREHQPCTSSLSTPAEVAICLAYEEGKNCDYLETEKDKRWCAVILNGSSCLGAFAQDLEYREMCEKGYAPYFHVFWAR